MITPDERVQHDVVRLRGNAQAFVEFVKQWHKHELDRLPYTQQATAIAQGRCQVLKELERLLSDDTDFSNPAKRQQRDLNSAHQ